MEIGGSVFLTLYIGHLKKIVYGKISRGGGVSFLEGYRAFPGFLGGQ